jgi:hypothetical protein
MRYLCGRPRIDWRVADESVWTSDFAERPASMETHRSRADSGPGNARRLARTVVSIVAALAVVGILGFCASDQFAPDETPQKAIISDSARIEAPNVSPAVAITPAAANAEIAGSVEHASHEADERLVSELSTTECPAPVDDDRCRRQVVGVWEDDYQGRRRLTVRDDGTARMVVEPSGIAGKVFASKLTFEIEWTLADGRIVMTTVGGEPRKSTNLVINLYGTRAEYRLLHLDDDQLLLLDADGKTRYDWRRVDGKEPNGPK